MQTEHTRVSVIIPTLNGAKSVPSVLSKLHHQEQPINEIIIADSGSDDNTPELAKKLGAKVLHIKPGTFDHGKTRNLAANIARGNILVFMTQDAIPVDTKLILKLIKPLDDPQVAVSYARQVPLPGASLSEQYLRLANYPPDSKVKSINDLPALGINTFQCSNVCAAYRRRTFEALDGFPHPAVCNEDMLFSSRAIQAGYKIAYTAEARIQHSHNLSCKELFKRYFDISASLDHEPDIRNLGRAEARGLTFFINQLTYLRDQKILHMLPRVILETGAKFIGFKFGANHTRIPQNLKEHLGLNKQYWSSQAKQT